MFRIRGRINTSLRPCKYHSTVYHCSHDEHERADVLGKCTNVAFNATIEDLDDYLNMSSIIPEDEAN